MIFAQIDPIDELDEEVGDIKWSSIKDKILAEQLDYWSLLYGSLASEQTKMKILVTIKHSNFYSISM